MDLRAMIGLRPKTETALALRTALTDTQAALAAMRERVAELEAGRGAVLLDSDAATAARHEAELIEARTEAERLAAMASALPARVAAAVERELAAELDTLAIDGEATAAQAAAMVPRIVAAAAVLAELVQTFDANAAKVQQINRRLRGYQREKVVEPMRRPWPRAEAMTFGKNLSLPGPRGACENLAQFRREVARAELPADPVAETVAAMG